MNLGWLEDGRKIPDEVMSYIRVMAVHAVRELGQSPEEVVKVLDLNRACIYHWLRLYDEGGYSALESAIPEGAEPLITPDLDQWLKETVVNQVPVDFGYDMNLWTCTILAELLKKEFKVTVSDSAVRYHLKKPLIRNRKRPLILLVDHATFHHSKPVREFVRAHRSQLRIFFLPKRAPEMNPDEQVWNEVKTNPIGKQPVKDKRDLKKRLRSALGALQKNTRRILSFFKLPDTQYAAQPVRA
jgi:transposase